MTASTTSTSSQESNLSILQERIPISALEELAKRHGKTEHVTVQSPPLRGSYNLVYSLIFPDGRKWVARIPDHQSLDIPVMQSDMVALRLIREKTNIPIPIIHAYDTSSENQLGMPYVLMDFIEGVPLDTLWNTVDEAARKRIFEQVAGYMSQLNAIRFDKIGRLQYDEGSGVYSVGPCRRRNDCAFPLDAKVIESGPFTTTHAYLSDCVQTLIRSPRHDTLIAAAMRLFALSLPDPNYDGPPFVLSHPDFDSQNVLVDPKTFTITGFIDWDGVAVGPRQAGFARYPAWITRDWDPTLYDWRATEHDAENDSDHDEKGCLHDQEPQVCTCHSAGPDKSSFVGYDESPETLQHHRELYLSIYSAIDPDHAGITRQSHIFESLEIALNKPQLAGEILVKLCSYVFHADRDLAMEMVSGVESGEWLKSLQCQGGSET